MMTKCDQPPRVDGEPRNCESGGYCLCRVYREARQRCIERGEGWRWGVEVIGMDAALTPIQDTGDEAPV